MSMGYLGVDRNDISFRGDFTAQELREKVKAFETLFGTKPRLIQVTGQFESQDGDTVFAQYNSIDVVDIGKRGEWVTAAVDGGPVRIKVQKDRFGLSSNPGVRLYF